MPTELKKEILFAHTLFMRDYNVLNNKSLKLPVLYRFKWASSCNVLSI